MNRQFSDVFPPPFRATGCSIYGVQHGKSVRIATITSKRFTAEGEAQLAQDMAAACNSHDALMAENERLRTDNKRLLLDMASIAVHGGPIARNIANAAIDACVEAAA